MITAVILAATISQTSITAEFFPSTPGTRWTYETTGDGTGSYTLRAEEPGEVLGNKTIPVSVLQGDKAVATIHYRFEGEMLLLVAHDAKHPLQVPQPVFKVGPKNEKWTYEGVTPFQDTVFALSLKGESRRVGKRKWLDKEVECVEVKEDARVSPSGRGGYEFKRTYLYARGIGLIEQKEVVKVGKDERSTTTRLVKFEPPTPKESL